MNEPKYKVGDELYRIGDRSEDDIVFSKIVKVLQKDNNCGYEYEIISKNEDYHLYEDEIDSCFYTSKNELIDAQIAKWEGLRDKCNHESDGLIYCTYPSQYKCIKCGEHYKG